MITGIHTLVYAREAESARAFFRDVLGLSSVDSGGGWPIFALPPAELGVHPTDGDEHHEITLMCDDIHQTVAELTVKGVTFSRPIRDDGFGLTTSLHIPGGGEMMLYEPRHPTALVQP